MGAALVDTLLAAALASLVAVQEPRDADAGPVLLELACDRSEVYVGASIAVHLRIGVAAGGGDELVPLVPQALDLPVHVDAAWLAEGGALARSTPSADAFGVDPEGRTFVLGGTVARARAVGERWTGGRRYALFEHVERLRAESPGELVLDAAVARYASARRFQDDVVRGRVPLDRVERSTTSNELRLRVLALPDEARPPEFGGAIGRYRVSARAEPVEIALGESVRVELRIAPEDGAAGAVERFAPPDLARADGAGASVGFGGFVVRGTLDRVEGAERVVAYDLEPRSTAVDRVPPIAFASFDPGPPPEYVRVRTASIPILVRAAPAPSDESSGDRAPSSRGASVAWIAGAAVLGALALVALVRRRARDVERS